MRLQKSLPLFLAVAFVMALAVGCAQSQQAETPATSESTEEMGNDNSMSMPDSAMSDSAGAMDDMDHSTEGNMEGSSDH